MTRRGIARAYSVALAFLFASSFLASVGFAQILRVNIYYDQSSYLIRDMVTIYGNVTYDGTPVNEGMVAVQVNALDEKIVARTVKAVSFPSLSSGILISEFYPSDSVGNRKNTIKRGTSEIFKATVNNTDPVNKTVLIVVNIYDNSSIPIDISSTIITIGPGSSAVFVPSFNIVAWAALGSSKAYVSVWTDWPMNQGYPCVPEKATSYEIVDSGVGDSGSYSQQTVVPGQSYQADFRLSPESPPGTYKIYVSAWSKGSKASDYMSMFVDWAPTPPRASFVYWPPMVGPNVGIKFRASSSTAEGYNDTINTITGYNWNFGDGTGNTTENPLKAYSNIGQYEVTLNVTDGEGFWNTTSKIVKVEVIHDVAMASIQCLSEIYSNWTAPVTVRVLNNGTVYESFNLTAYCEGSLIGTASVVGMEPFSERTIPIAWNTTGVTCGQSYVLTANVSLLAGEVNFTNNLLAFGPVSAKMLGDVVYDRIIDIYDVVAITARYEFTVSNPQWNPQADLAEPYGTIDIFDVVTCTSRYDQKY